MRWFRLYTELIDDPKQSKMDDKTFRTFILLLCLANELDQDGVINLSEKDIAWRLRCSKKQVESAIDFLKNNSILSNGSGPIEFINWKKRNFKSDDIGLRVQRYRNKKSNVTSNVTVTANVTPPDTDTEQKKKNTKEKVVFQLPRWIEQKTWSDFLEMRKKKRAPNTMAAMELTIRSLTKLKQAGDEPNEVLRQSIERGYTGVFALKNKTNAKTNEPAIITTEEMYPNLPVY